MTSRLIDVVLSRNALLVWIGRGNIYLGDQIHEVAITWLVWDLTKSSSATALVLFVGHIPFWALGWLAGVYADRLSRQQIVLVANAIRGVLALLLVALYGMDALSVEALAAFNFLLSACSTAETPAFTAQIPGLVAPGFAQTMNAVADNTKRVARLVGPMLIGIVQRLFPLVLVYLIVSASYFAMSLCQWLMRVRGPDRGSTQNRLMADVREGWTATRRSRSLFLIVICFAIYNVTYGAGFYIILPRLAGDHLQGGVAGYGLAVAMYGAGGIVGNIVLGLISVRDKFRVVLLGFAFMTLGFAAFGLAPNMTVLLVVCAVSALGLPMMDVCMPALIHELVEPTHHGRVYATWRYLAELGITIGIVSAGPVVDLLGPSYAAILYAALIAPVVCVFFVLIHRSQAPRAGAT